MSDDPERGNWLERRLATLEALYQRFGRDGFRGQSVADVNLLLTAKELQFRDTAEPSLTAEQQAARRHLELEVRDIRAYLRGQVTGLSLADLRGSGRAKRQRQDRERPFRSGEGGMEWNDECGRDGGGLQSAGIPGQVSRGRCRRPTGSPGTASL
jgi:hypothetical protein